MKGAPLDTPEFAPDWSLHPGVLLRRVLDEQQLRQSELAERAGLSAKHVNQIVNRSVGITGDVAVVLERALGVPAQFWTRAEADYQLHESTKRARLDLAKYGPWANAFDAATLRREGIVSPGDATEARVEKILRLFRVASPEAFEQTWMRPRVSFRRSQVFRVAEQNTALWLRLVERTAERVDLEPMSVRRLRKVARNLASMTNLSVPDGFVAARAALADAGVALTFVREIPGTRVCAATWWLDAERPVIGLTERQRKPDIFWFNLAHEVGHLLLHPRRMTFLDLDRDKGEHSPAEDEANAFAADTLIPPAVRERLAHAGSRQDLVVLAAAIGVGVAVVAGQYAKMTDRWDVASPLRGKITDEDVQELERLVGADWSEA